MILAYLALIACGEDAPQAPEATDAGRQFTDTERASGEHCLGEFVPYVDALGNAVLLSLPEGDSRFDNDRTYTRGAEPGREVVMEFSLLPSGRKGVAVATLVPADCSTGNVDVRFANEGSESYPIAD